MSILILLSVHVTSTVNIIHHEMHECSAFSMTYFDSPIYFKLFWLEERLWSPLEQIAEDTRSATSRLSRFRCLLNQRGVAAAPLAGNGRTAPYEPGPCVRQ